MAFELDCWASVVCFIHSNQQNDIFHFIHPFPSETVRADRFGRDIKDAVIEPKYDAGGTGDSRAVSVLGRSQDTSTRKGAPPARSCRRRRNKQD